jgi:hypothetical protein
MLTALYGGSKFKKIKLKMDRFTNRFLIIGLLTSLLLISCAAYKNSIVSDEVIKLSADAINFLNMTFSANSYKHTVKKGIYKLEESDLIMTLNRVKSQKSDTTNCKSYKIKFISADTLLVQGLDFKDSIITNTKFDGSLENGFFNLNNKMVEFNGIPYLFGGSGSEMTRIGLSKNNDLIVQTAVDQTGAFLFVFGTGYSYNIATFFKEIK